MPAALTRRAVLAAAAGASVLAGCGLLDRSDDAPAPPSPDEVLRAAAAREEAALLALYDRALATFPQLAPRLAALRAEHAQHLAALVAPVPTATATPAPVGDVRLALRSLIDAERAAVAARTTQARSASPELTALLGSIAASEASHLVVLAAL